VSEDRKGDILAPNSASGRTSTWIQK